MLFKKTRNYITPPGDLFTPGERTAADCLEPGAVAEFITAAGVPSICTAATAAPQVARYDMQLLDIYSYNETKIKKAIKALSARFHCSASLEPSASADYSITLTRTRRDTVNLRECMFSDAFDNASRTSCAAGIDTNNRPVVLDIAKAPHVLIAGTTGSGKSVLLNSMIVSLLCKVTPATGKLIMIDPKQVELTAYEKLPHLERPIITDAADAVSALSAICEEMERRYNLMARKRVKQLSDAPGLFPRWYVVIDELADLMLTSRRAVESSIVRIAQLGRAAGIHLIIATQRPTTNIITGLIKANIPTKIALTVSNVSDSITILNHGGAEKLTGRGDAIIKRPDSIHETRFQAALTPEEDIRKVIDHYTSRKCIVK